MTVPEAPASSLQWKPFEPRGTKALDRGQLGAFGGILAVAVLPTVLFAVRGAGFLSDDYWIAYWFDDLGVSNAMQKIAFEQPGRPLAALVYALQYAAVGERPIIQVAVLIAANLVLIWALWRFGRHFLPDDALFLALLIFAALPNHASTRLWFVVATYPLAVALVALAGDALATRRVALGCGLLVTAVLLYEGVAAFGFGVVLLACWPFAPEARRIGIIAIGGLTCATVLMFVLSPRPVAAAGGTYPGPFSHADTLGHALIGAGVTGHHSSGALLFVITVGVVVMGFAGLVPWFRSLSSDGLVIWGTCLVAVGAAPMLVGGSVFAVRGVNDRNNLVASVGVALIFASPLARLLRWRRQAGVLVAVAVASALSILAVRDIEPYVDAVAERGAVEAGVHDAIRDSKDVRGEIVVLPEPGRGSGVAAFINPIDLQGALHLHAGGDWGFLHTPGRRPCQSFDAVLDWRNGELLSVVEGCSAPASR